MQTNAAFIICMAITALEGIYMLVTKKSLFRGADKYTEESMRNYAAHAGYLYLFAAVLIGVGTWAINHTGISLITLLVLVAVVVLIIAAEVLKNRYLVKKQ